jgi:hypothetical protein
VKQFCKRFFGIAIKIPQSIIKVEQKKVYGHTNSMNQEACAESILAQS